MVAPARAEGAGTAMPALPGPGRDRAAPTLVLYAVEAAALVVLLVARHFGIVADEPWWAYGCAVGGSSLVSRRLDRWSHAPRGSWRLHARVCMHAVTVLVVIYLTGWGPALGLCFVYAALVDLQQSGPASWRAVLGWSLVCCGVGQLLVFEGWMPSFLTRSQAMSLGFLGVVAFAIVIIMAGAIGEAKQRADDLLAGARDEALRREAHHRSVVENAAEGFLSVDPDGRVDVVQPRRAGHVRLERVRDRRTARGHPRAGRVARTARAVPRRPPLRAAHLGATQRHRGHRCAPRRLPVPDDGVDQCHHR